MFNTFFPTPFCLIVSTPSLASSTVFDFSLSAWFFILLSRLLPQPLTKSNIRFTFQLGVDYFILWRVKSSDCWRANWKVLKHSLSNFLKLKILLNKNKMRYWSAVKLLYTPWRPSNYYFWKASRCSVEPIFHTEVRNKKNIKERDCSIFHISHLLVIPQ